MDDQDTDVEVVASGAKYALGEASDYYGVWEHTDVAGSLVRFPKTEDGFDAASRYFGRLTRVQLWRGDPIVFGLSALLAISLFVWIVAGGIVSGLFNPFISGNDGYSLVFRNSNLAQSIAFRVWVGSLSGLAAVWLARKLLAEQAEKARPSTTHLR